VEDNKKSLISVLICTYNGEKYLNQTLDSIATQTYNNYEVVIVDDGSDDRTKEIIKEQAASDRRISYYFMKNSGLAEARNYGILQCKGDWIAIIDQDDICYSERLDKQLKLTIDFPDAELIFSDTNYIDDTGLIIGHHLSSFNLPPIYIPKLMAANLLLAQGCYIDSESCFIKRSVALALGKLDNQLSYACDYDYFIRAGFKINFAYSEEVLSAWRRHSAQESITNPKRFSEYRRVLWRYFFRSDVFFYTKLYILKNLSKSIALELLSRMKG
jgi:glycosyltransferase involved in cell wall biosynthesis